MSFEVDDGRDQDDLRQKITVRMCDPLKRQQESMNGDAIISLFVAFKAYSTYKQKDWRDVEPAGPPEDPRQESEHVSDLLRKPIRAWSWPESENREKEGRERKEVGG